MWQRIAPYHTTVWVSNFHFLKLFSVCWLFFLVANEAITLFKYFYSRDSLPKNVFRLGKRMNQWNEILFIMFFSPRSSHLDAM